MTFITLFIFFFYCDSTYITNFGQALDGPTARIAEYFDVIAGTSTGGLVATMLAAPATDNRPMYAAKDITSFYIEHSPKIFPESRLFNI